MFILLILVLALLVALLRGGKFGNLAAVNIRWRGVILSGFALQVLVFSAFWQDRAETRAFTSMLYVVSLGLLLAALIANRRLPGLWLITLGFFLNFAVIALNGGYMPSSNAARLIAGRPPLQPGERMSNSVGIGPDTRLGFLADVFAIPNVILFSNVFSIGDVCIALGAFLLIQKTMVNPAQGSSLAGS